MQSQICLSADIHEVRASELSVDADVLMFVVPGSAPEHDRLVVVQLEDIAELLARENALRSEENSDDSYTDESDLDAHSPPPSEEKEEASFVPASKHLRRL